MLKYLHPSTPQGKRSSSWLAKAI